MLPRTALALFIVVAACSPVTQAAPKWRPVTPEDFSARPPAYDPDAGGVVLFQEMKVDNSDVFEALVDVYARFKVFNTQGIETINKTEIQYFRDQWVTNLAARVVKPDGRTIEVDPKAIFTRDIVRVGYEAIRAKTFAFAGIEPGDIAEFQYHLVNDGLIGGMRFFLDADFPTNVSRIRLKPFEFPGFGMQTLWSGGESSVKYLNKQSGYHVYEARNVPTRVNEPFAPPDSIVRAWFVFYFAFSEDGKTNEFWKYKADELRELSRTYLKSSKRLEAAAKEITAGAATDREMFERLYTYCATKIKNLSYDTSGYTPDEIEKLKKNKNSTDTLVNGYGTRAQINLLFGALVRALGGRCEVVYCGDRSEMIFSEKLMMGAALPDVLVAIERADWVYYDPGSMYLPMGKIDWRNQGTKVMVAGDRDWQFRDVPVAPDDVATTTRKAQLKLAADGSIEGDITITRTGHQGFSARHFHDNETDDEKLKFVRDALVERLANAEVTKLEIKHVGDAPDSLTISYHVRSENYAEVTSNRVFLQPGFFQKNEPLVFGDKVRKAPVVFPYRTAETDEVVIDLPEGFQLEPPGAPRSFGNTRDLFYLARVSYSPKTHQLVFKREVTNNIVGAALPQFHLVKSMFDRVHELDSNTLAMNATAPVPAAATGTPAADATAPAAP